MVEVFAIKTVSADTFEIFRRSFLQMLPAGSREAVLRFRMPRDEQRSLLGECLARYRLSVVTGIPPSELDLTRSEKGKPELADAGPVHFNISHSGDWVVVAVAEKEVGIDVEKIRDPQYRIAERFFSKPELTELNRLDGEQKTAYFFDLWTLKESYLKLLGKGLTQSLGSFTVVNDNGTFRLMLKGKEENGICFRQYPIDPAYKLSVCSYDASFESGITTMTIRELQQKIRHGKR